MNLSVRLMDVLLMFVVVDLERRGRVSSLCVPEGDVRVADSVRCIGTTTLTNVSMTLMDTSLVLTVATVSAVIAPSSLRRREGGVLIGDL